MSKIKLIIAVFGVLVLGPALNSYAMMGGGYGNGPYNHMTQGGNYRSTHMDSYTMGPGYYYRYDSGYHMSADDMDAAHYGRYRYESNRSGRSQYRQDGHRYDRNDQRGNYRYEQKQYRNDHEGR